VNYSTTTKTKTSSNAIFRVPSDLEADM